MRLDGFLVGLPQHASSAAKTGWLVEVRDLDQIVAPDLAEHYRSTSVLLGRPERDPVRNRYLPWWVGRLERPALHAGGRYQQVSHGPFFVIGAPRSGTTFLGRLLDSHPEILATNETRNLILGSRVLARMTRDPWCSNLYAGQFHAHLRKHLPHIYESFYRSLAEGPVSRWGDKHPHYADPSSDPEALAIILELWPTAQFIHILRDPRRVIASILRKGWTDLDEAIDVWARHVVQSRQLARIVGAAQFLEVRHETLVHDARRETERVLAFLGQFISPEVADFLEQQEESRTPFSSPTTEFDIPAGEEVDHEIESAVERVLGNLLVETKFDAVSLARGGLGDYRHSST